LGTPAQRQTVILANNNFTVNGPTAVTVRTTGRRVFATLSALGGGSPYSYSLLGTPTTAISLGSASGELHLIGDLVLGFHTVTVRVASAGGARVEDHVVTIRAVMPLQEGGHQTAVTAHTDYIGPYILPVRGGVVPVSYSLLSTNPASLTSHFQLFPLGPYLHAVSVVKKLPPGKASVRIRAQDSWLDTVDIVLTVSVFPAIAVGGDVPRSTILSGVTRGEIAYLSVTLLSGGSGDYKYNPQSNPPLVPTLYVQDFVDTQVLVIMPHVVSVSSPQDIVMTIQVTDNKFTGPIRTYATMYLTVSVAVPLSFSADNITVDVLENSGAVYTMNAINGGDNKTYNLVSAVTSPITVALSSNGVVNFGAAILQLSNSVTLEVSVTDDLGSPAQKQTVVLFNGIQTVSASGPSVVAVRHTDRGAFAKVSASGGVPPFGVGVGG